MLGCGSGRSRNLRDSFRGDFFSYGCGETIARTNAVPPSAGQFSNFVLCASIPNCCLIVNIMSRTAAGDCFGMAGNQSAIVISKNILLALPLLPPMQN